MKSLWKKIVLPRSLEGSTGASVEMSFMERGSFESQFPKDSFLSSKQTAGADELQTDEFAVDEDRAHMM